MRPLTLAVCGNHQVNYCTEAELAWTLETMGHRVLRFQENHTSTEDMLRQCVQQEVQLFLYVHTHHWSTPGEMSLDELFMALRGFSIRTASFHLDRFWGLDTSDKRESHIGRHPFWHTDRVFTADGGNQVAFEARGVNHTWLPPAVASRHCHRGTYRSELACNVAFVGSRAYHPEYLFRTKLIDWLSRTYHQGFRRFAPDAGGVVREELLNDVYASALVVVGDSCFAGSPYYWSDRVPETLGRGGFLLHPTTPGLVIDGLVTYEPGNLVDLQQKIDHYIWDDHDRHVCTNRAMLDVVSHHTYTQRMGTLLATMGLV